MEGVVDQAKGALGREAVDGLDGVGLFFIPSLPANVAPKRNWDALGFGAVGLGLGRLPNGATGLVVGAGGFGVAPAVSRLYLVELAPSGDVAAATALAVDALFPPVGDRLTAFLPPDAVITTPWRRRAATRSTARPSTRGGCPSRRLASAPCGARAP